MTVRTQNNSVLELQLRFRNFLNFSRCSTKSCYDYDSMNLLTPCCCCCFAFDLSKFIHLNSFSIWVLNCRVKTSDFKLAMIRGKMGWITMAWGSTVSHPPHPIPVVLLAGSSLSRHLQSWCRYELH